MQHRSNKIAIQHYVDIFDFFRPSLDNKLSVSIFIGIENYAWLQGLSIAKRLDCLQRTIWSKIIGREWRFVLTIIHHWIIRITRWIKMIKLSLFLNGTLYYEIISI